MNLGDWLSFEARRFRESKDQDRLRLLQYYLDGYEARESDPDRAFAAFSEGKRFAELINEPWWVLFYDNERVEALLHFKRDYRNVLEHAVRGIMEVRKPTNATFPGRTAVYDALVSAYLGIDALGYADKIVEALNYLEKEIPPEPEGARYLLLARQRMFAMECENHKDAYACCQRELDLAAKDNDQPRAVHFAVFTYCTLCQIADQVQDNEVLTDWSATAAELAKVKGHLCELGEAMAWQAVAALNSGDAQQARTLLRTATSQMARLKMPPKRGYFDALARYHSIEGDPVAALKVRDQELASIVNTGRLLPESRVRIQRLVLLRHLGRMTQADITEAREAAGKLKQGQEHFELIEQIVDG